MTRSECEPNGPAAVSIGIFAWNEAAVIETTLRSLLAQSLFPELQQRGWRCELICVANGCSDGTARVAAEVFAREASRHPCGSGFDARVADLRERGKFPAWNQFVHALSARSARYLFMMDADIWIHQRETLWNMLRALEEDPEATVAVDRPCKDIAFKPRHSLVERLSLAASRLTLGAEGQLCGQLYCIRAEAARNIYLPKDLAACEDGYIKTLVCTDFMAHEIWPRRIRVAADAEHTFEAYTSPGAILRNQKRQIIGQTIVHILADQYLSHLPRSKRLRLAETLRDKDAADPSWLKRLIHEHLARAGRPWRLYPGLLSQRFRRLRRLGWRRWPKCLPAAVAATGTELLASFLAYRSLRAGCTDYWPQARRAGLPLSRPRITAPDGH